MDLDEWIKIWSCTKKVPAEHIIVHKHLTLEPGNSQVEIELPLPPTHSVLEKVDERLQRKISRLMSFPEFHTDSNRLCLGMDIDGEVKISVHGNNGRVVIEQGFHATSLQRDIITGIDAPEYVEIQDEPQILTNDLHINFTPRSTDESLKVYTVLILETNAACEIDVEIKIDKYKFKAFDWEHIYGIYADDFHAYQEGDFDYALDELYQ